MLDYMQDDKLYAEEIIYGHTISRVEVKQDKQAGISCLEK
jgi:hypothetical protein